MTPAVDAGSAFGASAAGMAPATGNSEEVKSAFSGFPAAVGALCVSVNGDPYGIVATSLAVGASYDPPMVMFAVRNESTTWPLLRASGRIGVSVLAESQGTVCRRIATKADGGFADLDFTVTERGALFIGGATTWMDCEIAGELPAGDHTVVTLLVHEVGHDRAETPLLFLNGNFPRLRA